MKKIFSIILVIIANVAFAQQTITGLITDKANNVIHEVIISARNSEIKVLSDASGKYSITVPQNCKSLKFSKKGFKSTVVDITANEINVSLVSLSAINFTELSIDELMNIEVTIASGTSQKKEEAPSIVSVITQQEIEMYGARDLSDILRRIPGFEFGVDVQGLYGLGFRGIWAHEGKALIMIDGMGVNCMGFGAGNYFGTLPVNMVEQIEVIRGPGSAIYGGFAEVAVVNIITRKGSDIKGIELRSSLSSIEGELGYNSNISIGGTIKNDLKFTAHIGYMGTPLSSCDYSGFIGPSFKMGHHNSFKKWNHIILNAVYKDLEIGYNNNSTFFQAQDLFGTVLPQNNGINTNRLYSYTQTLRSKYTLRLNDNISIEPVFEFERGNPISTAVLPVQYSSGGYLNPADMWQNASAVANKYLGEVLFHYNIPNAGNLTCGIGYEGNSIESKTALGERGLQTSANIADTTDFYFNSSKYALIQYTQQIKNFGFIIGSRFEITPFGNAFVPRTGLTFVKGKFNTKLLYGWSYRVPMFWQAYSRQFFVGEALKPELSNTAEIELGYHFNENISANVNLFHILIDKPITYIGATNSYQNFGKVESMGAEGEIQIRYDKMGGFVNISYAIPGNKSSLDFVTGDKANFLALPPLKINVGGYINLGDISIAPSATYLSKRYGQSDNSALNSTPTSVIYETKSYDDLVLLNLNISTKDMFKKLKFNVEIDNILNVKYSVIQPYYGGHAPLPVNDRQITLGVTLSF